MMGHGGVSGRCTVCQGIVNLVKSGMLKSDVGIILSCIFRNHCAVNPWNEENICCALKVKDEPQRRRRREDNVVKVWTKRTGAIAAFAYCLARSLTERALEERAVRRQQWKTHRIVNISPGLCGACEAGKIFRIKSLLYSFGRMHSEGRLADRERARFRHSMLRLEADERLFMLF